MFEPQPLSVIADLVARAEKTTVQLGTVRHRHVVVTLEALAEDLVGRHSPEAVALKIRVSELLIQLAPERDLP